MSGQANAGFMLGYMIGQIALFVGPIVGGFVYANHLNSKKSYEDRVKWPIAVGFGVSLLFLLGQCSNMVRQAEQANTLVVEKFDGIETEPFPPASEFAAADMDVYANGLITEIKSKAGQKNLDLSAISAAIDGQERTIVRTTLFLDGVPTSRMYVAGLDGHLRVISCFYETNAQISEEDMASCKVEAQSEFGEFVEESRDNG